MKRWILRSLPACLVLAVAAGAFLLPTAASQAQPHAPDSLDARLLRLDASWSDDLPLERALFVAEGLRGAELDAAHDRLEALVARAASEVGRSSGKKAAKRLFRHLHRDAFRRYAEDALPSQLLADGTFNCVSASAAFVLAARRAGLDAELLVTPVHVYATFRDGARRVPVELTDPKDGLRLWQDQHKAVRHLLDYKLVTEQDVRERGEEALYREFVDAAEPLSDTGLLAVVLGNRGAAKAQAGDAEGAAVLYERAFSLAPDVPGVHVSYVLTASAAVQATTSAEQITRLARPIFERHAADTLLSHVGVEAAARTAMLASLSQQYEEAAHFAERVRADLTVDAEVEPQLRLLEASAYVEWAQSLTRLGKAEEALAKLHLARATEAQMPVVDEMILALTCQIALETAMGGQLEEALGLVEPLLPRADEAPVVTDTYARLLGAATSRQFQYGEHHPERLEAMLAVAEGFADPPPMLGVMGPLAHHELAMRLVRERDYAGAHDRLVSALARYPDSEMLRSDLDAVLPYVD